MLTLDGSDIPSRDSTLFYMRYFTIFALKRPSTAVLYSVL
jgi:hypothetical protein